MPEDIDELELVRRQLDEWDEWAQQLFASSHHGATHPDITYARRYAKAYVVMCERKKAGELAFVRSLIDEIQALQQELKEYDEMCERVCQVIGSRAYNRQPNKKDMRCRLVFDVEDLDRRCEAAIAEKLKATGIR